MQRAVRKLRKSQALARVAAVAVILRKWDPLSVGEFAPDDEYNSYAPPIVTLVSEGANPGRVAQHLTELQTGQLGVSATLAENLKVANEIVEALTLLPP